MELPRRKPTRLKGYDYSRPGIYFVTICTHHHQCILSDIVGAIRESPENRLTAYGGIVREIIESLPNRFPAALHHYVIMPNHIHLLLEIREERAIRESPLRSMLPMIVGYLKMNVSRRIRSQYGEKEIWQRGFHDHIIRAEDDYLNIWEYIENNPARWAEDCFYMP